MLRGLWACHAGAVVAHGEVVGGRWEHRTSWGRTVGAAAIVGALIAMVATVALAARRGQDAPIGSALPLVMLVFLSIRLLRELVVVDGAGVRIQGAIWSRLRPWDEIDGFRWGDSGQIAVAMHSGELVPLPGVKVKGPKLQRADDAEALCQQLDALRPGASPSGSDASDRPSSAS